MHHLKSSNLSDSLKFINLIFMNETGKLKTTGEGRSRVTTTGIEFLHPEGTFGV